MTRLDPHSYNDDQQPTVEHYRLDLRVDFEGRRILGEARLELSGYAELLDLDTRGLSIMEITGAEGVPIRYELGEEDPVLGARLRVFSAGAAIRIRFVTSQEASALQWLEPAQTAGGRQPFMYTQCQPVHARSIFPCQDSPRVRSSFRVYIETPAELTAVMAAQPFGAGGKKKEGRAVHRFTMPQKIPSYLFAFAVGELDSVEVGPRTRIYAEPSVVEAAAFEFSGTNQQLSTAEALFGPYRWDRYDMLVLPPSFPYGGMENPRLTFLTPTLIAGDRSLVSVVAHELAHSWTGNLVTNASVNDFWLNEGFTVYAERRIIEALEGEEQAQLQAALGLESLKEDMARLSEKDPELTRLRTDLSAYDPDEVYSSVPYEKGYLFVRRMEENVGRERFDRFLRDYIERFAFQSITTQALLDFIQAEHSELLYGLDVDAWVDKPGLPADAPQAEAPRLAELRALADRVAAEGPEALGAQLLDATEWQVLLNALPDTLPEARCAALDEAFELRGSSNYELRVGFLSIAAASGYAPAMSAAAETLKSVGRMKYLRPLYSALIRAGEEGQALAAATFEEAAERYHPVARALVQDVILRLRYGLSNLGA